ncbi:MAG: hypothetical protein L3I91_02455 [Mycoplasma sp.]
MKIIKKLNKENGLIKPIYYRSATLAQFLNDVDPNNKLLVKYDTWLHSPKIIEISYCIKKHQDVIDGIKYLENEFNSKKTGDFSALPGNYVFVNKDAQDFKIKSRGKCYIGKSDHNVFKRIITHLESERTSNQKLHNDLVNGDHVSIYIIPIEFDLDNNFVPLQEDRLNEGSVKRTKRELIAYFLKKNYILYNTSLGSNDSDDGIGEIKLIS